MSLGKEKPLVYRAVIAGNSRRDKKGFRLKNPLSGRGDLFRIGKLCP